MSPIYSPVHFLCTQGDLDLRGLPRCHGDSASKDIGGLPNYPPAICKPRLNYRL
ncbi:hypothetical protein PISMIDRAFT_683709 [Pisolithus microcarpus 441]|uniref:Unplaced genomic scaffold scaffold_111, whole genome shotgun sequence n=1 Tax=Pisolithus microcarpus 441 TaxID=765257 RepID=A0A0C9Y2B9_9AGAM|nr:hypothetical protein PISMIDRAFT_683709 [Pisolithus microcarpus 441]